MSSVTPSTPASDALSAALLVFCTCPDQAVAERLARLLVDERLVACANLLPGLRSIYRWQGAVQEDAEILLLLKTTAARMPELTERIARAHPYEVPEVIAMPIVAGLDRYLQWVEQTCDAQAGDY